MNSFRDHVLILPEDDANRQIAQGFLLGCDNLRSIQILRTAGGWRKLIEAFKNHHVAELHRYPSRRLVLLLDLDLHQNMEDRLQFAKNQVPSVLSKRVFILGAWSTPELLRTSLQLSYETIGRRLAEDCRRKSDTIWSHELLQHNTYEVARLQDSIHSLLFAAQ